MREHETKFDRATKEDLIKNAIKLHREACAANDRAIRELDRANDQINKTRELVYGQLFIDDEPAGTTKDVWIGNDHWRVRKSGAHGCDIELVDNVGS